MLSTNEKNWSKHGKRNIIFPVIGLNIAVDRAKSEFKCETVGDSVCCLETAGTKVRMTSVGSSFSLVYT